MNIEPAMMQSAFNIMDGSRLLVTTCWTGPSAIKSYLCDENWKPIRLLHECPRSLWRYKTQTEYHENVRKLHKPEMFVPEHSTTIKKENMPQFLAVIDISFDNELKQYEEILKHVREQKRPFEIIEGQVLAKINQIKNKNAPTVSEIEIDGKKLKLIEIDTDFFTCVTINPFPIPFTQMISYMTKPEKAYTYQALKINGKRYGIAPSR